MKMTKDEMLNEEKYRDEIKLHLSYKRRLHKSKKRRNGTEKGREERLSNEGSINLSCG